MLTQIFSTAQNLINQASTTEALQQAKILLLGKQSLLSGEMKKLSSMSEEEKKKFGAEINKLRNEIQTLIDNKATDLAKEELNKRFAREKIDLTIPAPRTQEGGVHPLTQVLDELISVFSRFGFTIKEGPSIETEWYNFTALNIDQNHPARQMHDTFYLKGDENKLLRTQTSPIQIRQMGSAKPPFRFIAPGRTYRCDSDMTHTPMFHQIEGLVVDTGINMGHLKYVIVNFIKDFFEKPNIEFRFRPNYFPFTEPSAEVDIKIPGRDKWLEVLGCGMVHPKVFENVGMDSKTYKGFAFGLGVERFAMLKYGIKDLRQFYEGDFRWLKHYSFSALDIPSLTGGLIA